MRHRKTDRRSWRAMLLLFATSTIGVIIYLNLKAGPSYGAGFLPTGAPHEARERDYFFVPAFLCWGMWAGYEAVRLMRGARGTSRLAPVGVLAALLPVSLNWNAVNRRSEPVASEARLAAARILASAPMGSVVLARGDNETYPVWYLQHVEGVRSDVTVVVIPLLPAQWYRAELERRYALVPHDFVVSWRGGGPTLAAVCSRASELHRSILRAGTGPDSTFPAVCETR